MAITHDKAALKIVRPDAVMLELITREWPEGASQTFVKYSPLAISAGLAVAFVAPGTAKLAGFALSDGHNVASGASVSVVLATSEVEIEANFLGAAAAANVLAAADFGGKFDLLSSATLLGASSPGWYISDATADVSVRITQFPPIGKANESQVRTAAGDTNARVRAMAIYSATHWDTT